MAQLYRRKGGDMLVNTQTAANQSATRLAVLQDGGYVVVWTDDSLIGGDSSDSAIKAQRFDADGNKVGGEFLVNTTTTATQTAAAVATLASGRFVVTWTDPAPPAATPQRPRSGASCSRRTGRRSEASSWSTPQTAGSPGQLGGRRARRRRLRRQLDRFERRRRRCQRLRDQGAAVRLVGRQGRRRDPGQHRHRRAARAARASIGLAWRRFRRVWTGDRRADGLVGRGSIRLQLFDSAGAKVGGEQVVNAAPTAISARANIAALARGFVVTWAQQDNFDFAGSLPRSTSGPRCSSRPAPRSAASSSSTASIAGSQTAPDVHALPGGGFIVTWQGPGEGTSALNVYGQIFDSAGARQGAAVRPQQRH